jgi:hypothetical protein
MKVFRAAVGGLTGTLCATLFILAACAGNGDGLDANGRPLVPGGVVPPLSADFNSIQANIFTPICSVCHAGGSAPEGLRLDAANSFNLLVGVPSTEEPALQRVQPGDPDSSYIIQKLEGHAAVGAQMPLGGPYLTTDTIAFIRQWITNGALPSATGAAPAAAPLAITSIVPDSVEPVSESPPQIMIAFSHDLDITQINSQSLHIERVMPAASSAATEIIPARVTVSSANLRVLMVWPSRPLSVGHYRLGFNAGSSAQFSDIAGNSLSVGAPNEMGESVISTFDVEVLQ